MADNPQLAARPIIRIAVDQIDIPADRLRALKPKQAAAIGAAIAADRQYDPISVARLPGQTRYLLVDGLHRLEGCRVSGLEEIEARLVSADRKSRLRHEAMTAWARADHDVFDKAAQVAAMVELAKEGSADPEDGDQACLMIRQELRWDLGVAKDLGVSRATVMFYLRLHRIYDAGQKKYLRDKGLASDLMPLIRLAALPPEKFAAAWSYIEETADPTIAGALIATSPSAAPPCPIMKARGVFFGKFDSWAKADRADFIADLLSRYDVHGNPLRQNGDGQ